MSFVFCPISDGRKIFYLFISRVLCTLFIYGRREGEWWLACSSANAHAHGLGLGLGLSLGLGLGARAWAREAVWL